MRHCFLFPENDWKSPIDICNGELLQAPTTYYFPLDKDAKACSHIITKDGKTFAKFTWENVVYSANKKQQKAFNLLRTRYVKTMIIDFCSNKQCQPVMVGSPPSSALSDIDFDFYSNKKDVVEVIHLINTEHHKFFKDSIENTFDINLYGTVSDIFANIPCTLEKCKNIDSKDQHIWAFMRVCQYGKSLYPMLSPHHKKLYKECVARKKLLHTPEHQHKLLYLKYLDEYLTMSKKKHFDPAKLAHTFSKAKFYERETYRSVGATLHIVKKKDDLPTPYLHDSIYDNFGFILEVAALKCYNHDYKIMKICKYVSRICNALLILDPSRKDIRKLKDITHAINRKRKNIQKLAQLDLNKLFAILHCDDKTLIERIYDLCLRNIS
jgi:hypothetical protein